MTIEQIDAMADSFCTPETHWCLFPDWIWEKKVKVFGLRGKKSRRDRDGLDDPRVFDTEAWAVNSMAVLVEEYPTAKRFALVSVGVSVETELMEHINLSHAHAVLGEIPPQAFAFLRMFDVKDWEIV